MAHARRSIVISLTLAASLFSNAVASPATDLFEQAARYLAGYGGFSTVSPAELSGKYRAELAAACAPKGDACAFTDAVPVLKKLVDELGDGHTGYYSPDQYRDFLRESQGLGPSAPKMGIRHRKIEGSSDRLVVDVYEGSAAEAGGLRRGDRITAVAGRPLAEFGDDPSPGIAQYTATGQPFQVTVRRGEQTLELTVQGRPILAARMPSLVVRPDNVAVLKIPSFGTSGQVGPRVHELVAQASAQGVRAIIVDLRENGGGAVTECLAAVSPFVGDVARRRVSAGATEEDGVQGSTVYRRDPDSGRTAPYYRIPRPATWAGPVAVLVNEGTASCAELFAADVQFAKRGPVIGEATAGVGNTTTMILPLLDGGGLQVTLSRSVRTDGTSYPAKIAPDEVVKDDLDLLAATGRDAPLERALAAVGAVARSQP